MNRAPEETINRMSPSKHARTGMVGAVPTTGGTGTQRGPARCLYGLHTGKGTGHVPRPHRAPYSARTVARMGPVPFSPLPVPYRFARMGPVPFWPYQSRTVLPVPAPYRFAPMLPLRYRACECFAVLTLTNHICQCHFCLYLILTNHICQCHFCLYLITYQPYLPVSFFACIWYLPTIFTSVIFACISYLPTILTKCHFCLCFVLTNYTCQCHFCSRHDPLQPAWCQFPVVLFVLSPCEEQSISKMLCRKFMMNCPFYVLNKSYVFFSSKFFTIQHLKIFLVEQV